MNLSIVIPVYFEDKNIILELEEIKGKVKTPHEVIVVYDLSNDPTIKVVESYIKKNKLKNIFLKKNNVGSKRGVINAVKTGIYFAIHLP